MTSGSRPRKGRRVAFAPSDRTPQAGSGSVTGLRFDIEAASGGTVSVNLVEERPRRLVLAFAAGLRLASDVGGSLGAASTIKQHVRVFRLFFAYLREQARAVDGPEDLRSGHIDGFEDWLQARKQTDMHRHITLSKPIGMLRVIGADRPGLLDAGLERRLAYVSCRMQPRSQPRDAYSPFVARQLRDAARADVDAIRTWLGTVPAMSGDAETDTRRAAVEAVIDEQGSITYTHPAFRLLYMRRYAGGTRDRAFLAHIHARRYLTGEDVIPLLVLLGLATGLEIECCKALAADCLHDPSQDTVEIAYVKRRARGAEHKRVRVRDGAVSTSGGLIRVILDLTAAARRHCLSESLWVYFQNGGFRTGIRHPKQQEAAWVARHGIVDDEGRPLRLELSRLRKTHKALWYVWTQGDMARFAVGHTREVAARHYAQVPALLHLHEAAIAAGLTDAFAVAAGPLVLGPDAEERARAETGVAHPALPEQVAALLNGAQDVWLTSCGDFYNSPFGGAGEPCPQPFWGCLECSNAVFTARKLPALLALLGLVTAERERLDAADWAAKFGRVHARITQQILPAFPDALLADARRVAEQAGELPYLPPELLT